MRSRQYSLPLPHLVRMSAEDFMVTESNSEATAWINRWPEWPSHCLVIHGPAGCGKTHLAHMWRDLSKGQLLSSANLTTSRPKQTSIAVDDAAQIAGNKGAEETLFHLFNNLKEQDGFLLLLATLPPAQWSLSLPDLRSRLLAAPTIALLAPDDALLSAMLVKQFRDRQLQVENGVLDYLLPRIERSAAAVRDVVELLDAASLATTRGITLALARQMLSNQSSM